MELTRYDGVTPFYRQVEGFLLSREAEHNLILGICASLLHDVSPYDHPPYLASVQDAGHVVAAAMRTPPHNLIVSLAPPDAPALFAADAHRVYPTLPGVIGPREAGRAFAGEWQRLTGQPYRLGISQRIYALTDVTPLTGVPGSLRRATEADRELIVAWLAAFEAEALPDSVQRDPARTANDFLRAPTRALYLWEDGRSVSMAGSTGPTPNGIRVTAVYTPPELRGRGYASACVAALSRLLLDGGRRYCFLFTDLSNPTSNSIYQRIGYSPVVDIDEYRFQGIP